MDMKENFSHRRHSIDAVAIANISRLHRMSIREEDIMQLNKFHNRRHSVMIQPRMKFHGEPNLMGRRQSRRFSIMPFMKLGPTTFTGLPLGPQPIIKEENTYKMKPDEGTQFKAHIVKREAQEVLNDVLEESHYMNNDATKTRSLRKVGRNSTKSVALAAEGGKLAKELVTEIKDRIKTLKMDRYKFVVNAFVGECKGQDLRIASRSLWDTSTDGCVTVQHKTDKHYAIVVIHAVYFE